MKKNKKTIIIIILAIAAVASGLIIGLILLIVNSARETVDNNGLNSIDEHIIDKAEDARKENDQSAADEQAKLAYMSLSTEIEEKKKDENYNAIDDIVNLAKNIAKDIVINPNTTQGWKKLGIEENNKIIMIYTSDNLDKDLKYEIIITKDSASMENNPIEVEKEAEDVNSSDSSDIQESSNSNTKDTFNKKFEQYIGENIEGSKVNLLIEAIKENNETMQEKAIRIKANVSHWDYDSNIADNQANYKVSCEYDDNGYINTIFLEDAKN